MTKGDAIMTLLRDAKAKGSSLTSYKRVSRALRVLDLGADADQRVLFWLCYTNGQGELYDWLKKDLAGGSNHNVR